MYSVEDWHDRFQQQARWTASLREYLYHKYNLAAAQRVLEVGCGTGVIADELSAHSHNCVHAIEPQWGRVRFAKEKYLKPKFMAADGFHLPYPDGIFDITCCHFLFLWVKSPALVLAEMKRVTKPGGYILALAEPDYGGRIDYPEELAEIGHLQTSSLKEKGADPFMGRKLGQLFHQASLIWVETGILGAQWTKSQDLSSLENEWSMLQEDLQSKIGPEVIQDLIRVDQSAWQQGERILYVPTFYAAGQVP
jgi:ubiquinone/menaquinone biosynthesis C-methylase UbiE